MLGYSGAFVFDKLPASFPGQKAYTLCKKDKQLDRLPEFSCEVRCVFFIYQPHVGFMSSGHYSLCNFFEFLFEGFSVILGVVLRNSNCVEFRDKKIGIEKSEHGGKIFREV